MNDKKEFTKKRSLISKENQFSLVFDDDYNTEPECEHFLKIGCKSKDYTIFKKCKFNLDTDDHSKTKRNSNSPYSLNYYTHNIYFDSKLPIVESETNRVCLAKWKIHNPDETEEHSYVVLSKQLNSPNNSITCSIWETSNNQLKIKDDHSLKSCLNREKINKFVNSYKNYKSNGYSISASAMLSNKLNHNDQTIVFEYSGTCSSNNSNFIKTSFFLIKFCFIVRVYLIPITVFV